MSFEIREMTISDLRCAVAWAGVEGWNPGISDAECFYSADPHGFFMAFEDGRPAGSVTEIGLSRK